MAWAPGVLASHPTFAHPDLNIVATGGKAFDHVNWSYLNPCRDHFTGGAAGFSGNRLDEKLPSGRIVGCVDDAVVSEVEKKRRGSGSAGILEHGL